MAFTPSTISSAEPSWQTMWHDLEVEVLSLKHRPSHRYLGHGSMYRSRSQSVKKIKINGWAGEKRVVPYAHPSHPRTGTPHGWGSHILCCARTGDKGPAVLTVTKGHVPVRKLW